VTLDGRTLPVVAAIKQRKLKANSTTRAQMLGGLSAVYLATRAPWARAQTLTNVRMAAYPSDAYAEPFYALDGGYFNRAGLNVDLTVGPVIVPAVVTNILDIGLGDPIQVANPVNAGVDLAIFAAGGVYDANTPQTLMCVPKNSPLRTAKDLEGQSIGVLQLASMTAMAVKNWMTQSGVNVDNVKLIEFPYSSMAAALEKGTLAAAMFSEPFLSITRNDLRVFGKPFDSIAKLFYISTFFAQRTWLDKHADVALRLRGALYDVGRWANTHRYESAEILAKHSAQNVEQVRAMTRVTFSTALDERYIQPLLDVAYKFKQLAKPVRAADLIWKG
jgi:NitT/TauT family transport system substrate-binding protein